MVVAAEQVVVHINYVFPFAAAEVNDVAVDEVVYGTHMEFAIDDTQHRHFY